jgi:hypothetical protein
MSWQSQTLNHTAVLKNSIIAKESTPSMCSFCSGTLIRRLSFGYAPGAPDKSPHIIQFDIFSVTVGET